MAGLEILIHFRAGVARDLADWVKRLKLSGLNIGRLTLSDHFTNSANLVPVLRTIGIR